MKKIQLQAWAAYHIFVNQEVEVPDTSEASLEDALKKICEETVLADDTRPIPAIMEGPTFTELE